MISEETKLVFSFFSGLIVALLVNRIIEFLKRKNIQKNITMFYNESIGEFREAIKTIGKEDGEEKYLSIQEKLNSTKSNLEKLLTYSWAIERLKPKYYVQLQKRSNLIQEIEKSPPFNGRNHWSINLDFLRRYENEITTDHKKFKRYIDNLNIT